MIAVERSHLHIAAITHPGMRGKNNEDRYAVSAYQVGRRDDTPSLFGIVADGVGGHRAGEVAAEIAVEHISRRVAESDASDPLNTLRTAFLESSQAIYERSITADQLQGMSTTCACAWIINDRLYIAAVGDSRIYLLREDRIQQLTTDHTWVQEAVDQGALTLEQARQHPNAHVIRRHLGSQQPSEPDFRLRLRSAEKDLNAEANQGMRLHTGDRLLLCSDGLTDLVEDEEILAIFSTRDRDLALHELVELANERGGHDNITIVAIQVPEQDARFAGVDRRRRRNSMLGFTLGLMVVLLFGVALIAGLFLAQDRVTADATAFPTIGGQTVRNTLIQATLAPTGRGQGNSATLPTNASTNPVTLATLFPETQEPSVTPVQATYTPWPTSTLAPLSLDR